jgi:hypothetical protein
MTAVHFFFADRWLAAATSIGQVGEAAAIGEAGYLTGFVAGEARAATTGNKATVLPVATGIKTTRAAGNFNRIALCYRRASYGILFATPQVKLV